MVIYLRTSYALMYHLGSPADQMSPRMAAQADVPALMDDQKVRVV